MAFGGGAGGGGEGVGRGLGDGGVAEGEVVVDEADVGDVEGAEPGGFGEVCEVHVLRLESVVADSPVEGEEAMGEGVEFFWIAEGGFGEEGFGAVRVEKAEGLEEFGGSDEFVDGEEREAVECPGEDGEAFKSPAGVD